MKTVLFEDKRFYWVLGYNSVYRIYYESTGDVWVVAKYAQTDVHFEYENGSLLATGD